MDELKIDYEFNLYDFKTMENIEHSYFPNENISPAEEVLRWYEKNNLTCIGVRNSNNEVIASVSILPLKSNVFNDIYHDKMNEADVISEQIETYENNKSYLLYLSSISIDEKYRNNYRVIMTLLKGCINLFNLLEKRNIKIEKIMAEASTTHGENLCKKLLKMDCMRDTSHKSKIYCTSGDNFANTIKRVNLKI